MASLRIACLGECMVELTQGKSSHTLNKNFAGDTYNTAYYLKKLLGDQATVSYLTAVGVDGLSQQLVDALAAAQLDTSAIRRLEDGKVGLYLVENDPDGERHFVYWRETSAAKRLFDGEQGNDLLASLSAYDMVYLSGISLAILAPEARERLIQALTTADVQVVFDPNYRPKLWGGDTAHASAAMCALVKATQAIVLTTLDDEQALNNLHTDTDVEQFWIQHGAQDVVVKKGAQGCFIASEQILVPSISGIQPIDTTGAGDSFNGGYLAGRAAGLSVYQSATQAHRVAAQVIQHRGAIIPNLVP